MLPCIMFGQLLSAASFGPLKGWQLMAPAALLAEALHFAGTHELLLLDVHFTNMAPLVIGAEVAQVSATVLHLADRLRTLPV